MVNHYFAVAVTVIMVLMVDLLLDGPPITVARRQDWTINRMRANPPWGSKSMNNGYIGP